MPCVVSLLTNCCQSCRQSYWQLVTVEFGSFSFSTFFKCKLLWKLIKTQGRFLITVLEHVPDWSDKVTFTKQQDTFPHFATYWLSFEARLLWRFARQQKKSQLIGFTRLVYKISINWNRLSNKTQYLSKYLVFILFYAIRCLLPPQVL